MPGCGLSCVFLQLFPVANAFGSINQSSNAQPTLLPKRDAHILRIHCATMASVGELHDAVASLRAEVAELKEAFRKHVQSCTCGAAATTQFAGTAGDDAVLAADAAASSVASASPRGELTATMRRKGSGRRLGPSPLRQSRIPVAIAGGRGRMRSSPRADAAVSSFASPRHSPRTSGLRAPKSGRTGAAASPRATTAQHTVTPKAGRAPQVGGTKPSRSTPALSTPHHAGQRRGSPSSLVTGTARRGVNRSSAGPSTDNSSPRTVTRRASAGRLTGAASGEGTVHKGKPAVVVATDDNGDDLDDDEKEKAARHAAGIRYEPFDGVAFAPTERPEADPSPPMQSLELAHVFGYNGATARNNVFFTGAGDVVYFTAAIGVVQSSSTCEQRHFLGHDGEIKCLDFHRGSSMVATGQVR